MASWIYTNFDMALFTIFINNSITCDIFIYVLVLTIVLLSVFPFVGAIINRITSGFFRFVFSFIDRTNHLFLIFANVITWPGVVIHELSHGLWVILTGAKITHISLYHRQGNQLGSVTYIPRGNIIFQSLQKALVSCAPVFMGLGIEAGILYVINSTALPIWGIIALLYIFIAVLVHMDMSKQDIACYFKGIPVCFILVYCIILLFLLMKPEIYLNLHQLFYRS